MSESGPDTTVRSKPIMERHLQSFLLSVVTLLVAWQGYTTFELSKSSARQDERILYLTQQVTELHREWREQRDNNVSLNEFERRMGEHQREINSIRDRVRTLEERR